MSNPSPTVSYFSVSFNGEIEGVKDADGSDGLFLQYQVVCGTDWQLLKGEASGVTQTFQSLSRFSLTGNAVFNHPLSLQFRSSNISGWPRLVVTLYGMDLCRRRVVKGYGSIALPTQPGKHERSIRLFVPRPSSLWVRFMGWLNGRPPIFNDPTCITQAEGREHLKVETASGTVKISLNVLWKDHKPFDLSIAA